MIAPGTVVDGRYTIVRLVAEGGMSEVYEVADARLAGRFALKRMRDWIGDAAVRREMAEQFEREANTLATLSHPNLPRVTDHFDHEGRHCLVEELVDGDTLEVAGPGADLETVLGWGMQICDALEYLHGRGIVYRDLKPSNCMVTRDGVVKLIDFGIVRFFSTGKSRDTVIMGTPGFAAPEQYGGEQTDGRADIFALGVLLHHLLTGHDPTATPFVFPPLRRKRPDLSEHLERVITKSLSLDPAERFETVDEMRLALRGDAVLLDGVERFVYAEEPPRADRFALTSLGIVGTGVGTAAITMGAPTISSIALCYLPLWLAVLVVQFVGRRRRAVTAIEATRGHLVYRDGRRELKVAWDEVRTLSFTRESFLGIRVARVSTRHGEFPFVVEGSRGRPGDAFDIPALEGAQRLCSLLVQKAGLSAGRPGAEVYVRGS